MRRKDGAAQLAEIEQRTGQTHEQIAKRLKTTGATVSRLVTRERGPGLELAVRIRKVLGIPVEAWTRDSSSSAA